MDVGDFSEKSCRWSKTWSQTIKSDFWKFLEISVVDEKPS